MNKEQLDVLLTNWSAMHDILSLAFELGSFEDAKHIIEQLTMEDKDIRVSKTHGLKCYE